MKCLLLLLTGCLICQANLVDIFNIINAKVYAADNFVITSSVSSVESDEVLKQLNSSKFIYSTKTSVVKPLNICNRTLLSVVFLEPTWAKQQQQLNLLSRIAGRHARSLLLFVSNEYQNLHLLFGWCWTHGYKNAIFTAVDSQMLFTYTPFPRMEIFNTTLDLYFKKHYAQRNFKGYPIRFSGGVHVPRSIVFENSTGHLVMGGIWPRLLKMFARVHNATLHHVTRSENYTIVDCFELTREQKVDLCTEQFYLGGKETLTRPLHIVKTFLLVPAAGPLPSYRYFGAPFTVEVWLLLGLSFCLLTIVLTVISWYRNSCWCIGAILLDVVASVLFLSFKLKNITGRTRGFLYIQLVIFGLLFTTIYIAFLSSVFTVNLNDKEIESVADLKKRNISILVHEVDLQILGMYKASKELIERTKQVPIAVAIDRQLALDPNYAHFCASDKCNLLMEQQKFMDVPRVRVMQPPIFSVWPGMLLRHNTFIKTVFETHLQRCFEAGIYKPVWDRSYNEALRMGLINNYRSESRKRALPIPLEFYIVPAIALFTGYALALVAFLCELIIHRYSKYVNVQTICGRWKKLKKETDRMYAQR